MAYRDGYETKEAIIGICLDLMHDTSPEDINVSDIAEAAALSRQTFYYHFHSVYDILPWIICKGDWSRYNEARPPNNGQKCTESPSDEDYIKQFQEAREY